MNGDKSWDKIRLKVAPKDYKRGPGPTGTARLQRSVNSLLLKAVRLSQKDPASAAWCEALIARLKDFNEWTTHDRPQGS